MTSTGYNRFKRAALVLMATIVALTIYANVRVLSYERYTTSDIAQLPTTKACLVLGTSRTLADGRLNLFFRYRIAAAVRVFQAGKCSSIVVSGDNRRADYNEPEDMRASLVEAGIPAARIFCDYAGGRTLDSVVRFRYIFGQTTGIVISQQFHNARAIYIGKARGIDLVGFNAQEVDAYNGFRTKAREVVSRLRAVVDIELLHSAPKHFGDPVSL